MGKATLRLSRRQFRIAIGWLITVLLATSHVARGGALSSGLIQTDALELSDQELTQALRNLQDFYATIPLTAEKETQESQAQVVDELASMVVKDAAAELPAPVPKVPVAPINPIPSIVPPAGNRTGRLISATLLIGQKQTAFNTVNDIVKKLQVPGDPTRYTLHFS